MLNMLALDADLLVVVLAAAAAVLLVLAVLLLVLWLRTRRKLKPMRSRLLEEQQRSLGAEAEVRGLRGRVRVMRDLHDVVIQELGGIVKRADGAAIAADRDPALVGRAAAGIADNARGIIAELRRVVDLAVDAAETEATPPGLGSLPELFTAFEDAGLSIEFEQRGESYALRPGAEVSVYRVVQESLGNALQHGGPGTQVRVLIVWTGEGLRAEIDDDGKRNRARLLGEDPDLTVKAADDPAADLFVHHTQGPTLTQLRDRVEIYGGVFNARETPGVGFSVSAAYPALRFHNGVHGVRLR